ncbi:fimbrial biogenesis chaperone [Paraburkholderia lacunae]|nr:molecular chaperone [Paraburkholderia lacunae]
MTKSLRKAARWTAGFVLATGCAASHAANFTVSPVRVELSAAHPSIALTVRNESADEPVVVQLRTVAWSQDTGDDIYAQTTDLLAAPPIFTIPAGASQVIRIGLRRPPTAEQEISYRLFLREVPPAPKPGFAGVQIALEMSLPVFIKPKSASAPVLHWQAASQPGSDGALKLIVKNDGTAHAQVANLVLSAAGNDRPVATHGQFAYILPGQSRQLTFTPSSGSTPPVAAGLHLTGYSDAGDIDSNVAPGDR